MTPEAAHQTAVEAKKKTRTVFDKESVETLNQFFSRNPNPSSEERDDLAAKCSMTPQQVYNWFFSRRAKAKKAQQEKNDSPAAKSPPNLPTSNLVRISPKGFYRPTTQLSPLPAAAQISPMIVLPAGIAVRHAPEPAPTTPVKISALPEEEPETPPSPKVKLFEGSTQRSPYPARKPRLPVREVNFWQTTPRLVAAKNKAWTVKLCSARNQTYGCAS